MQSGELRATHCEPELAPACRLCFFSADWKRREGRSGPIRQNGERMVEVMVQEVEWKNGKAVKS